MLLQEQNNKIIIVHPAFQDGVFMTISPNQDWIENPKPAWKGCFYNSKKKEQVFQIINDFDSKMFVIHQQKEVFIFVFEGEKGKKISIRRGLLEPSEKDFIIQEKDPIFSDLNAWLVKNWNFLLEISNQSKTK